jgi:hypothetical protein
MAAHVTRRISSVVAYWSLMCGVTGSNPGQIKIIFFFFHAAAMLLFYIIQRFTFPKFCIFWKSTIYLCTALLQVALVSIPPHKFVRLPCWYYRLQETAKYDFRVVPNGITSIPNFTQICPAVLKLNHVDRQTDMTWPALCVHFMYTMQKTHKKCCFFKFHSIFMTIIPINFGIHQMDLQGMFDRLSLAHVLHYTQYISL